VSALRWCAGLWTCPNRVVLQASSLAQGGHSRQQGPSHTLDLMRLSVVFLLVRMLHSLCCAGLCCLLLLGMLVVECDLCGWVASASQSIVTRPTCAFAAPHPRHTTAQQAPLQACRRLESSHNTRTAQPTERPAQQQCRMLLSVNAPHSNISCLANSGQHHLTKPQFLNTLSTNQPTLSHAAIGQRWCHQSLAGRQQVAAGQQQQLTQLPRKPYAMLPLGRVDVTGPLLVIKGTPL
jgi:hypothetical protein